MKHAFFRLFLILFPIIPIFLILAFPKNDQEITQNSPITTDLSLKTQCPPLIGVAPLFTKKFLQNSTPHLQNHPGYPVISETGFLKQISSTRTHLKLYNIPSKYLLITLPLYLTKDNHWVISKKSFIISQNLERIELSHLNYKDLQQLFIDTYKSKALTLNKILKRHPKSSLLLKFEGTDDQKILKQLGFLKNHRGMIYLASSHEKLLNQVSQNYPKILLLHTFKKLIRYQLLNILQINTFVSFPGDGVLIPSSLSLSLKTVSNLKKLKKLLILEEKNINKITKVLTTNINGYISSNFESSSEFIKHKRSCFLK